MKQFKYFQKHVKHFFIQKIGRNLFKPKSIKGKKNQEKFLPNSSNNTREFRVACFKMVEVSLSSTKKVLSPTAKHDIGYLKNYSQISNLGTDCQNSDHVDKGCRKMITRRTRTCTLRNTGPLLYHLSLCTM